MNEPTILTPAANYYVFSFTIKYNFVSIDVVGSKDVTDKLVSISKLFYALASKVKPIVTPYTGKHS